MFIGETQLQDDALAADAQRLQATEANVKLVSTVCMFK
jgi:hypothetical protein